MAKDVAQPSDDAIAMLYEAVESHANIVNSEQMNRAERTQESTMVAARSPSHAGVLRSLAGRCAKRQRRSSRPVPSPPMPTVPSPPLPKESPSIFATRGCRQPDHTDVAAVAELLAPPGRRSRVNSVLQAPPVSTIEVSTVGVSDERVKELESELGQTVRSLVRSGLSPSEVMEHPQCVDVNRRAIDAGIDAWAICTSVGSATAADMACEELDRKLGVKAELIRAFVSLNRRGLSAGEAMADPSLDALRDRATAAGVNIWEVYEAVARAAERKRTLMPFVDL